MGKQAGPNRLQQQGQVPKKDMVTMETHPLIPGAEKVHAGPVEVPKTDVPSVVSVPDIPLPADEDTSEIIQDDFEAAFKIGVIGAGQGGSRIAQTFYQAGYRRVCCVNTAIQDLSAIAIPEENKLEIGTGGAGKNPNIAQAAAERRREDIVDLMRRCFGVGYDRILVTVGAGGGTGSGAAEVIITAAHDVLRALQIEGRGECKVGILVALPKHSEGMRPCANAFRLMQSLSKHVYSPDSSEDDPCLISPLIIIDNERIKRLYPKVKVSAFWNVANSSICQLFHLFNLIAARESSLTSFDPRDFKTILDSGIITFGAVPIRSIDDRTDISYAVRETLRNNILGAVDVSTGKVAGCVAIGSPRILDEVPEDFLDHGFEMLDRVMQGDDTTVHRGIYYGDKDELTLYTAIGGLQPPAEAMRHLATIGMVRDWDMPDPQ